MPDREVAVVGLGATGAFVARAAYDAGYKVTVYSYGEANTTPPGAFWLHWLPVDLTQQYTPQVITILGKGEEANYIKLQWGKTANLKMVTSSFPTKPISEPGYNPADVLPTLLPAEVKMELTPYPFSDRDVQDLARGYDFVFQTFPRKVDMELQPNRIPFVAAAKMGVQPLGVNIVVYNGIGPKGGIVVREAMLFGNHFLEFPKGMSLKQVGEQYSLDGWKTVMLKDLSPHTKPIPQPGDKVYLMGRYAQWDRKCLSHDCYQRTLNILKKGG